MKHGVEVASKLEIRAIVRFSWAKNVPVLKFIVNRAMFMARIRYLVKVLGNGAFRSGMGVRILKTITEGEGRQL